MRYIAALDILHASLRPRNYVEIGCGRGFSLNHAHCPSLAIDPAFDIRVPILAPTRFFPDESDRFFAKYDPAELLGGPIDFAFIDGMHLAEFALRDLLNLERYADAGAVVVIDDILPADIAWASRQRQSETWTGDVYKLIPFLRKARPDLSIEVFDIETKGLAVISGLTPGGRPPDGGLAAAEAYLCGAEAELGSVADIRAVLAPRPAEELAAFAEGLAVRREAPTPASPYLDLLKRSLLNEVYLDDELRLLYLRDCLAGADRFDPDVYQDIRDQRRQAYDNLRAGREIGLFPRRDIRRSGFRHTMMGRRRLDSLHACLDSVIGRAISGDFLECGVWRGGGCIFMAGYLKAHGIGNRKVIAADSFEGMPPPSRAEDEGVALDKSQFPELAVSLETVKENFAAYGLLGENVRFLKGWLRDTLAEAPSKALALLRLDGDLYESTMDSLTHLYDRVSPGGIVIVDDYGAVPACRKAVEEFFAGRNEAVPPLTKIDWTGVHFTKPRRRGDKGGR